MKRYEKMSKEEIIDIMGNSFDNCRTCPLLDGEGGCGKSWASCGMSLREYLKEEIKTKKVHRYELIKSPEDINKMFDDMSHVCDECECSSCPYGHGDIDICFGNFLKEEIEAEVE